MKFPLFVAKRYFVSKKSTNVINIISGISVVGVTIGTAALIIVLSVFNGFESLVISLYNSFDPNLKITPVAGKTFDPALLDMNRIRTAGGVKYLCEVVEDNCLIKYRDKQYIATVKGVDSNFVKMSGIQKKMTEGEFLLEHADTNFAVIGQGVAYYLSVNSRDVFHFLNLYFPRKGDNVELNPEDAFVRKSVFPIGAFSIQQDFDSKYLLVPLRLARELFSSGKEISALEIGLSENADMDAAQKEITELAGPSFKVRNRYQLHEVLYKIMKSEKWAVYLILSFILLIATFNIIGSLTMLIIEKKKDIAILHALGADSGTVRKIFLLEGSMITVLGAAFGTLIGFAVCLLQVKTGIVKLHGTGSFVIDAYPVQMQIPDFVYVFLTVMVIGLAAAWFPAGRLTSRLVKLKINE